MKNFNFRLVKFIKIIKYFMMYYNSDYLKIYKEIKYFQENLNFRWVNFRFIF